MSWRIKNSWLTKNFYRQKVAKISKQHFVEIVVKQTNGAWNLGLNVPVLRLQCNSPMINTFSGGQSIAMAILWRPSLASDDSAMVHHWYWKKSRKKIVQVENWHVHVVKMKVKSHERQLSTEQEKLAKSNKNGTTGQKIKTKMSAEKTNAARTRRYSKKQGKNLVCDEQLHDEAPTTEGTEHWVYCSVESCERLTML